MSSSEFIETLASMGGDAVVKAPVRFLAQEVAQYSDNKNHKIKTLYPNEYGVSL